jgi:hypothetical protein
MDIDLGIGYGVGDSRSIVLVDEVTGGRDVEYVGRGGRGEGECWLGARGGFDPAVYLSARRKVYRNCTITV